MTPAAVAPPPVSLSKMCPQVIFKTLRGASQVASLEASFSTMTLSDLRQVVLREQGVPIDRQKLTHQGKQLERERDSESLESLKVGSESVIHVGVRGAGLLGGKGGFGAQLRILAKQAGVKKTTDFGMCRDLSGRRLRHVNDEKILQHWKEAKDRGEEYDPYATNSGVANWFLPTPTWAEGVGTSRSARGVRARRKTHLCRDWLAARQDRKAPRDAPAWWGCPRGRRCEFAHGDDELRGKAALSVAERKKVAVRDENEKARDRYFSVVQAASRGDDEIADLVAAGMQAAKRSKHESTSDEQEHAAAGKHATASATDVTLVVLSGELELTSDGEIEGKCDFGTAMLPNCHIAEGSWFYELELLTDGVMQVGWATQGFRSDVSEGDGVGDDAHSWAYDGSRLLKFGGAGEDDEYDFGSTKWKTGDAIGCLLSIDKGSKLARVGYTLNGVFLGEAHSIPLSRLGPLEQVGFYPAFSVEDGEALLLNIGQHAFNFPPSGGLLGSQHGFRPVREALGLFPAPVKAPVVSSTSSLSSSSSSSTSSSSTSQPERKRKDPSAGSSTQEGENGVKGVEPAPSDFAPVDLEKYTSLEALMDLGLLHLKAELVRRELKSGGSLQERAQRLLSVRGVEPSKIDKKLRAVSSNKA